MSAATKRKLTVVPASPFLQSVDKLPNCFGKICQTWAPECVGGKSSITLKLHKEPCVLFERCKDITEFHQGTLGRHGETG